MAARSESTITLCSRIERMSRVTSRAGTISVWLVMVSVRMSPQMLFWVDISQPSVEIGPEIRAHPCPSMVKLIKPLQLQGFLNGRTATVSETVSNAESHSTIRHYLSELAETLPQRAFTHAVETGLVTRQRGGKLVRRPNPARRFEDQTQRRPGRLPRQQDLKFSLSIIPRFTGF